jgi:steroid 5-alpha reductase family enzyme
MLEKHIRKIFSVFCLGMMVLFVMRLNVDAWTNINWMMMGAAAISCLLVFRLFVWIFNFSYGLVCMLNGALIAFMLPSISSALLGGLMFIYGARLFMFTRKRFNSDSYQFRVSKIREADAGLPIFVKVAMWVQCVFLYTFHMFGVYTAASVMTVDLWVSVAAILILVGILIESLADEQKQVAKRNTPDKPITTGVFARWRHPNYAGEVIVQIGLIVAGVSAVGGGWANYAAVVIAPLYVILLMIAESGIADERQMQRYGDDEGYKNYASKSGSLFPRL